jgi:hypothetical protein
MSEFLGKWIGHYENVIPDELCDDIISYTIESKKLSPSTYSTHDSTSPKSSQRVFMDDVWFRDGEDKYYEEMKEHTLNVLSNYQKIHKVVCKRYTDFRINRYSSGGFMSEHIDNIHHSHGQQYGYPHLSVLLFLNEDYKGGEFMVADNEYKTSKGSAIIFPSNFMFPHKVNKIEYGTRWSVISWLM